MYQQTISKCNTRSQSPAVLQSISPASSNHFSTSATEDAARVAHSNAPSNAEFPQAEEQLERVRSNSKSSVSAACSPSAASEPTVTVECKVDGGHSLPSTPGRMLPRPPEDSLARVSACPRTLSAGQSSGLQHMRGPSPPHRAAARASSYEPNRQNNNEALGEVRKISVSNHLRESMAVPKSPAIQ